MSELSQMTINVYNSFMSTFKNGKQFSDFSKIEREHFIELQSKFDQYMEDVTSMVYHLSNENSALAKENAGLKANLASLEAKVSALEAEMLKCSVLKAEILALQNQAATGVP